MRVNVCLFALLLVFTFSAAVNQSQLKVQEVEKGKSTALPCPRPAAKVTWRRRTCGLPVNILTSGDRDIRHIEDRFKRYSSLADKSLYIRSVTEDDCGTYYCNDEAAVELIVFPPAFPRREAPVKTSVTLTCPEGVGGPRGPSWSRNGEEIKPNQRFRFFPEDKTLSIRTVKPSDSGLYCCDGKPAGYLRVLDGRRTTSPSTTTATATKPMTPTTTKPTTATTKPITTTTTTTTTTKPTTPTTTKPITTTTTTTKPITTTTATTTKPITTTTTTTTKPTAVTGTGSSAAAASSDVPQNQHLSLGLLLPIVSSIFLLLLLLIISVVCFVCRRRLKKREAEEKCVVYEQIDDQLTFLPTHDASDQNEHIYYTIPDRPLVVNKTDSSPPDESHYSVISATLLGGNSEASSTDCTYFLLEKPKTQ